MAPILPRGSTEAMSAATGCEARNPTAICNFAPAPLSAPTNFAANSSNPIVCISTFNPLKKLANAAAAAAGLSTTVSSWSSVLEIPATTPPPLPPSPPANLLYRNVLYSVFDGDEEALRALVSDNLLSLQGGGKASDGPLPHDRWVNAGSPLLLSVMKTLVSDPKFSTLMDNMMYKAEIKKTKAEIDDIELELVRLGEARYDGPAEVRARLNTKLAEKTRAIKAAEDKIKKI